MLTASQLKKIVPYISDKNLNTYVPLLNAEFVKYEVNTPERIACFISQMAVESGSFNYVKEIASGQAYEGRIDLGNNKPGDGVKFKGRGLIQITGKSNYKLCSNFIFGDNRLLDHPELLEQPQYAVDSAFYFWTVNHLNAVADQPEGWTKKFNWRGNVMTYNKVQWITKLINGGQNGLSQRVEFYNRARKVLAETPIQDGKCSSL